MPYLKAIGVVFSLLISVVGVGAGASNFYVSSATASSKIVAPGKSVTIEIAVKAITAQNNVLLDLEVNTPEGVKAVNGQTYKTVNFTAAGETQDISLTFQVPIDASFGKYTINVGVCGSSWHPLFLWSTDQTSFTVGEFGVAVNGNKFVNTLTGEPIQLFGVSISGLEQGASALNTSAGDYAEATDPGFAAMASWNINLVRIPLNEDTWLGIHNCIRDGGSAEVLQSNVKSIVANANAHGLYVILDLHWAAPNAFGCPTGQGSMLDADNTKAFWTSVADTFKDNPAVIFEMMNEPFGTNLYANWIENITGAAPSGQSAADLNILRNGGTYDNGYMYQCNNGCNLKQGTIYRSAGSFNVVGMQEVLNAIRATGATNVVLANAMGWAGEIETWLQSKPTDPMGQLAAGWHEDGGGSATVAAAQQILNAGYPILITEAYKYNGGAATNVDHSGASYFKWATANKVGYSFWAWTAWQGGILNDTKSYTPNALGQTLKNAYCSQPTVNESAKCD